MKETMKKEFAYTVSKELSFSSAHYLSNYKGKCENLHGHNWKVRAILKGHKLDNEGMLYDFVILKKHLKEILDELDHKILNDIDFISPLSPTAENIGKRIFERLESKIKDENVIVYQVEIFETDSSKVTVTRA